MEAVMDKDLRDDMLKLVRYKILYVRREYEVTFPEQEDIVPDNMDGDAFTAWKVAEFIQDLARGDTPVPSKWADKKYPQGFTSSDGKYLTGIPHEDKKYLRVYYEVLERYPREKFKYEEQQIRVLEEIRDQLGKQRLPEAAIFRSDLHDQLVHYIDKHKHVLNNWRSAFTNWSTQFSEVIADTFNRHATVGEYQTPH